MVVLPIFTGLGGFSSLIVEGISWLVSCVNGAVAPESRIKRHLILLRYQLWLVRFILWVLRASSLRHNSVEINRHVSFDLPVGELNSTPPLVRWRPSVIEDQPGSTPGGLVFAKPAPQAPGQIFWPKGVAFVRRLTFAPFRAVWCSRVQ